MGAYLGALENRLAGDRFAVMQSNGGRLSATAAKAAAVRTILSGPAAGAVGARAVAEAAGHPRVIGFDMGGTSTDVCLIDGAIPTTSDTMVGDFPVRLPVIDIHSVGAGGGSIVYVDSGGALRVGPRSAGAVPGPACYGYGTELTVTDANLLLGRLDPAQFLGGRMTLDVERARRAAVDLGHRVGLDEPALAEGVVRIANANMERAIRVVSVQRGVDPREFALLAFGGAGGMHACAIAGTLGIATVIVPRHAGVLSALGMLLADAIKDHALTILRAGDAIDEVELDMLFRPLVAEAGRDLAREGFPPDRIHVERRLDVRYAGQSYELAVPMAPGFRDEFDRRHARIYGYADPRRAIEVVTLRVVAVGRTDKPAVPRVEAPPSIAEPYRVGEARFGGAPVSTAFFRWRDLAPGATADGPAVIAGGEATAVVPPGFRFRLDEFANVVATRPPAR
jgi:N-methylhydantoinase A/oxoprolinase/acetone carboxylase beta subunit